MPSLWPFEPETSIRETWKTTTRVMKYYSGEGRSSRHYPVQRLDYSYVLTNEHMTWARKLIETTPLGEWYVPVWFEAQTVTVVASMNTIDCSLNSSFMAGGYAILWQDWENYTIVSISSISSPDENHDATLTLSDILPVSYTDVLLMPLREAQALSWRPQRMGPDRVRLGVQWESLDSPELTPVMVKSEVYISVDNSGSMDATKISAVVTALTGILTDWKARKLTHDIYINFWKSALATELPTSQTIVRYDCDDADYDALIAWLATMTTYTGPTIFSAGTYTLPTLFSGTPSEPRLLVFVTDGAPSSAYKTEQQLVDDALDDINAIDQLQTLCFHIDSTDIQYTLQLDNTGFDSVPVLPSTDTDLMQRVLERSFKYILPPEGMLMWEGETAIMMEMGRLQTGDAALGRAHVTVDNGLGPVHLEPTRSLFDSGRTLSLYSDSVQSSFRLRQFLQSLRGKDRPFWAVEEQGWINILSSSATSIVISPALESTDDYVGKTILLEGNIIREVTSANVTGSNHQINFASATHSATKVAFMTLVRLDTDEIVLDHRGGVYTECSLPVYEVTE